MKRKKPTVKKGSVDIIFLSVMLIMIGFGLVMVFSASAPSAFYNQGDKLYYIKKQLFVTAVGFLAMYGTAFIGYKRIKKYATHLCIGAFGLLVLVLLIGKTGGGAQRWLAIGPFSFQPSEFAKFAIVLFFAKQLTSRPKESIRHFVRGLLPYLVVLGGFVLVMILQDHFSGSVIIIGAALVMLFAGGANLAHFAAIFGGALALFVPMILMKEYRIRRILIYFDPFSDLTGDGWQIAQGLYAIASGGIFGMGLGQSRQKFLYIPEAHNDYIYAIICEELGFVGAGLVAILFIVLITRGIYIAYHAPDSFSSLSVFGIIAVIGMQYIINVGVVTGALPNTGMQLPFFSAGGSSMIFIMAAMGVVLDVSRNIKPGGKGIRPDNGKTEEVKRGGRR